MDRKAGKESGQELGKLPHVYFGNHANVKRMVAKKVLLNANSLTCPRFLLANI